MIFFRIAFPLFHLLSQAFAYDESKYKDPPFRSVHDACQPSRLGLQEYTGFRIQHQISLDYPFDHHTRLTRCTRNQVAGWDAYMPMNRDQDVRWGRRFCTAHHSNLGACYILARRKAAAQRNTALYYHGDWVGGIFRCPGNLDDNGTPCTNENALPLYPLMADEPFLEWQDLPDLRHLVRRVPLVSTTTDGGVPHADITRKVPFNWWSYVDVSENYTFSDDERNLLRVALDFAANAYYTLTNAYVGFFVVPRTEDYYAEFGDGRPRRATYPTPQRHPFEAHNWRREPPIHPNHDFAHITPLTTMDQVLAGDLFGRSDDDENDSGLSPRSAAFAALSPGDLVAALARVPRVALDEFRRNATARFEQAVLHDGPIFSHPPPPKDIEAFLDAPY